MATTSHRERRKTWGQRVEERRLLLRLSQTQVADIAGLPQQTVSRVELDRVAPRYHTMAAIAQALGCPVEDLFPMEAHPGTRRAS